MPESMIHETEIDDFAQEYLIAMGFNTRPSKTFVKIYKEFKRRKDSVHACRLTPEGMATVVMLAQMAEKTGIFAETVPGFVPETADVKTEETTVSNDETDVTKVAANPFSTEKE